MKKHHTKQIVTLAACLVVVLFTTACEKGLFTLSVDGEGVEYSKEGEPKVDDIIDGQTGDESCVPNDRFFLREVWAPAVESACYACHNGQGQAKDSQFVLYNSGWGNYIGENYRIMEELALTKRDGDSVLLLKATGRVSHAGGAIVEEGDDTYTRLAAFVNRVDAGMDCGAANDSSFYQDVEFLDGQQVLRKATLSLAGRAPSQEEYDALGTDGLDGVLDGVMSEEGFKNRLVEAYNDTLLTDQFLNNDDAVELLDEDLFPDRMWYDGIEDDDMRNRARRETNRAIARESIEMIAYVITSDRAFTDVLNADFTLVNPFSARAYGVADDLTFIDGDDPSEWIEAQIPSIPHAGMVTTPVWMNKFPTTDTNRNRGRATIFYRDFLATDVLKLAERPLDSSQSDLSSNPTLFDAQCTVCHNVIDPVAGAFQNWNNDGMYQVSEAWHTDMLPPGLENTNIGQIETPESLRWLAAKTTIDPRFVAAAVQQAYKILTGDMPLTAPADPTIASYDAEFRAYEVQYEFFKQLGIKFVASSYNFKSLIKEIVKSPYYRAENASEGVSAVRQMEIGSLGTARLLSPEMLHRRILATTGVTWNVGGRDVLIDRREYNLLYGGIDSVSVIKRMEAPSSVASSIGRRMSNEVSCMAVPQDFTREEKLLFPHVTPDDTPTSNDAAIRANIKHLHFQLLGERVEEGDEDFERSYNLFKDVLQDGQSNDYDDRLPGDCRTDGMDNDENYTVRSWMAVTSYLLGSYGYLYE